MERKCLVISANNNLDTFKATIIAAREYFETSSQIISAVLVIRTIEGENTDNALKYKALCDEIFLNYKDYNEKKIDSSDMYLTRLPIVFRELLSSWEPNNIIVDLTNGTKSYTDFIYLACTLLDIRTIFRVSIKPEYYRNPNNNSSFEVTMECILSQKQVRSFVNKTYAEYIYYYSEVKELAEWIKGLYGEQMSLHFFRQMLNSFEKYAAGDYQDSINTLSTITEGLMTELLQKLQGYFDSTTWDWLNGNGQFSRRQQNNRSLNAISSLGSMSQSFGNIMTRANKIISRRTDASTQAYDNAVSNRNPNINKLAPIVAVGHALQAMAMTRNYNAHGSIYSIDNGTIHDARFQIDTLLFILHKMAECELLRGE